MKPDRPLRAIIMQTFVCDGSVYHKGEIYDIAKFVNICDRPGILITDGKRTCLVSPATIQILAPEPKVKPQKRKKKWPRKRNAS